MTPGTQKSAVRKILKNAWKGLRAKSRAIGGKTTDKKYILSTHQLIFLVIFPKKHFVIPNTELCVIFNIMEIMYIRIWM